MWYKTFRKKMVIWLGPWLAYWVVRILGWTMRFEHLYTETHRFFYEKKIPAIGAFWHGRLLMMPVMYRVTGRKLSFLVSPHRDGQVIGKVAQRFGYNAILGSSTRRGVSALRQMVKVLEEGQDLAIVPDGPRGPRFEVQMGVIELAKLTNRPIVPVSFSASRKKIFKTWDRFILPYPFSKAVFIWGEPVYVDPDGDEAHLEERRLLLEKRLNELTEEADHYFDAHSKTQRTMITRFSKLFYSVITTLFLLVTAPYLFARGLFDETRRKELLQRLGCFPDLSEKKPFWIHAASVGEVLASRSLIKKIKTAFPHDSLLLTTMTRTGLETAKKQIPEADEVLLFPLDHPLILRHVMKKVEPRLLLIAETELWPNLLRCSGKRGIPIVLFNGRISDRSVRRYLRLRFFFRDYLASISLFLMQTEQDQARIIAIGAPSEKTRVMGNIKYDQAPPDVAGDVAAEMTRALGLRGDESVFIAGSTRPGEEEILISLFKELNGEIPRLLLLLAPRHLDRLEEVEKILKREALHWVRRTSLPTLENVSNGHSRNLPNIILLDTMGELVKMYSLAKLVFVGGSLVPLGGQNPLEPLFFKKCVLFGPHMCNFAEIARFLIESQGAVQVKDPEDLRAQIRRLLQDDQARQEIGEKGHQVLQKHRGATERIFQEIQPFLLKKWSAERMEYWSDGKKNGVIEK